MKPIKLWVNIEDGVFEFLSPEFANGKLNELPNGAYSFTIDHGGKRSSNQNRYLHGVIIPMVLEGLRNVGFNDVKDSEDAKLIIKTLFLKRKIRNDKTYEEIELVRHTSELTTEEMNEFINDVVQWSAEYLGIQIPEPNSQSKLFAV